MDRDGRCRFAELGSVADCEEVGRTRLTDVDVGVLLLASTEGADAGEGSAEGRIGLPCWPTPFGKPEVEMGGSV